MLALIAICGRLGYALGMLTAIDPLSAFPATSRGVDSVMIAANRTVAVPLLVAGFVARGAHAAAAAAS